MKWERGTDGQRFSPSKTALIHLHDCNNGQTVHLTIGSNPKNSIAKRGVLNRPSATRALALLRERLAKADVALDSHATALQDIVDYLVKKLNDHAPCQKRRRGKTTKKLRSPSAAAGDRVRFTHAHRGAVVRGQQQRDAARGGLSFVDAQVADTDRKRQERTLRESLHATACEAALAAGRVEQEQRATASFLARRAARLRENNKTIAAAAGLFRREPDAQWTVDAVTGELFFTRCLCSRRARVASPLAEWWVVLKRKKRSAAE